MVGWVGWLMLGWLGSMKDFNWKIQMVCQSLCRPWLKRSRLGCLKCKMLCTCCVLLNHWVEHRIDSLHTPFMGNIAPYLFGRGPVAPHQRRVRCPWMKSLLSNEGLWPWRISTDLGWRRGKVEVCRGKWSYSSHRDLFQMGNRGFKK